MAPEEDTNSKIIVFAAAMNITLRYSREVREQNNRSRQGQTYQVHAVEWANVQ